MTKIAIIFLILISIVLQFKLWFKSDGIRGFIKLNKEVVAQQVELNKLKNRNKNLFNHIKLLKNNPEAIEEQARMVFGMIKPDETYYRVIEEK